VTSPRDELFDLAVNRAAEYAARLGLQGAMVQMISHGFISGALFTCVGVLYDRMHTRMIRDYGGVANVMPWFAALIGAVPRHRSKLWCSTQPRQL